MIPSNEWDQVKSRVARLNPNIRIDEGCLIHKDGVTYRDDPPDVKAWVKKNGKKTRK